MINYIISVDLGQADNYSALSVLRRIWIWPGHKKREAFDPKMAELRHEIPLLVRWPLQTAYPIIVKQIEETYRLVESESDADRVALIVDHEGPGRPIVDYLKKAKLRPVGITIHSGDIQKDREEDDMTCPKKDIVSALIFEAQSGWVKINEELEWAKELENEFDNFGYKINRKTGNMTYEAQKDSIHDDLVVSVAMGLWYSRTKLSQVFCGGNDGGADMADTDYNPLKPQRA